MFDKRTIVKNVVRFIVGVGTHRIISQVIDNNVTSRGTIDSMFIGAGSIAVGYFTSDLVGDYTDNKIDSAFDAVQEAFGK